MPQLDASSMPITRSLSVHAPMRREPARVLADLAQWLPEGMPAAGPEGPMAVLEGTVAEMLGKPAALFFPTGAMAQQVALRLHADHRSTRMVAGHPSSHIDAWERQGYSVVHRLEFRATGDVNGLLGLSDLAEVKDRLAAVTWELPQRDIGGRLPSWDELAEQTAWAAEHGAARHLDGARIWDTTLHFGRPLAEIAGLFDTAYVSLYKGMEAPRGAVLAGPADFIGEAEAWRLRLGGSIPEAWPLAAAALMGLDRLMPRLPEFLAHAREIAAALVADGVVDVVPRVPQTSMFHVHAPAPAESLKKAHRELVENTGTQLMLGVRSNPDPSRCSFEVSIGENAMEFSPAEVAALVRGIVERAREI